MVRIHRVLPVLFFLLVAGCANEEVGEISTTSGEPSTTTTLPVVTTTTLPPTTTTTLPPPTELFGHVVGPGGEPVVGATLEMGDVAAVSGEDGSFQIIVPAPGRLEVSRPGWEPVELDVSQDSDQIKVEMEPFIVRGLRVSAEAAGSDSKFDELLGLADATAVNTLVFDTKQEGGKVLYETSVSAANEMGAVDSFYDPVRRVSQSDEHGLYTITRIVVFEDGFRVKAHPEEKLIGGWVDPVIESAWVYNIDLAKEACEIGFDEIQFDYVRFPAGQTAKVSGQLSLTQSERVASIEGFLAMARQQLNPLGCAVSAAVFAIVVSVPDDQGLGQKPEELSRQLDALSPMVYPSHYSPGWLGYTDPNGFPFEVTAAAIDDAMPRLQTGTQLRPYLQAFWWSNNQIRESIDAAEDRGVGWILWNVRSNFDLEALPTDAEVSG
ncbi:MAG: putative glycoside hydrolase [Acidimicrobiia bacterium]